MYRTKSNQVQHYGNGYKRINMTNNVTIITEPDDILIEGVRILLVDLTPDQSEFISTSLFQLEDFPTTVVYSWKIGDSIPWLFDKFYKSSIVFFNADLSAPKKKNAAHAIVAAQIKNKPFNGPTAKNVASPLSSAILVDNALNLFIIFLIIVF